MSNYKAQVIIQQDLNFKTNRQ